MLDKAFVDLYDKVCDCDGSSARIFDDQSMVFAFSLNAHMVPASVDVEAAGSNAVD